jgi:membrane protease subunit (stomatin/prohibitin family)
MMRRRRPLLRAAAVGGTAYAVGRHMGRNAEAGDQAEADQNQQIADLQQQQAAAAPAPQAAAAPVDSSASLDELNKLGEMHKAGILTDEEFAVSKSKILAKLG